MQNPLSRWLSSREKVQLATTPEAREAVYRLRYEIYGLEKGWTIGGVDHDRQRVRDELDESPGSRIFYVGSPPAPSVKGTVRAQIYEPGAAPEAIARTFALDRVPGIERYRVTEVGRFAIRKEHRGGLVMLALVRAVLEHLAVTDGVDLFFCTCRPAMVKHYRKMGFRPYDAPNLVSTEGMLVPLICAPSDHRYLSAVGAIIADDAKRLSRRSGRPPVDIQALEPLFAEDNLRLRAEAERVLSELESGLEDPDIPSPDWAHDLPASVLEGVARAGYMLEVEAGDVILQEGRGERELYMLLLGEVEVLVDGVCVATLGDGEILGEMAWLLPEGRRTATVRARAPSRLMVVDRRYLDELSEQDPRAALTLFRICATSLARRLAATSRELAEARRGPTPAT